MSSNDELEARVGEDRQLARDAISCVVFEAIRERDHLRRQRDELQTYNTAVLERARKAEAERDAFAQRVTELEARIPMLQRSDTIPAPPDAEDEGTYPRETRDIKSSDALTEGSRSRPQSGLLGFTVDGQAVYGSGAGLDATLIAWSNMKSEDDVVAPDDDEPSVADTEVEP